MMCTQKHFNESLKTAYAVIYPITIKYPFVLFSLPSCQLLYGYLFRMLDFVMKCSRNNEKIKHVNDHRAIAATMKVAH